MHNKYDTLNVLSCNRHVDGQKKYSVNIRKEYLDSVIDRASLE